ncbi:MAG TPA: DUF4388 domain-containing protein [Myxococcales bacterium]|nr:DUF4388 domain-containing protein [Myxococcales bacterium]
MGDEGNSGAWKILEAPSDLLVALRGGQQGLWADLDALVSSHAVLAGDLREFAPSDLLNFLDQGRRTGALLTRSGDVERALVMIDGDVSWACSTSPGERLGELLSRMGMAERAKIDEALKEQGAPGVPHSRIGQLLVEKKVLTTDELHRALRYQCVEIFLGLLVAREGSFVFLRGVDKAALPVVLEMETQAILLDGLRRLDEMELYRSRVRSSEERPRPTGKPVHQSLPDEARQVMALADGQRTVADLAARSALGEFETTKAVFRLLEQGYLQL